VVSAAAWFRDILASRGITLAWRTDTPADAEDQFFPIFAQVPITLMEKTKHHSEGKTVQKTESDFSFWQNHPVDVATGG
jgi:hypothetical protein